VSIRSEQLASVGIFSNIEAVTPSNTGYIPGDTVGLYITGAGNIALEGINGESEIIAVADASFVPFAGSRVLATGTTATGIKALRA
jgi:hypothetical protein